MTDPKPRGVQGRAVLVAAAASITCAVTFSLGLWQLDRAKQKKATQTAISMQNELEPLDGERLLAFGDADEALHRRVALQGRWVGEHSVYLDNRPMAGKAGLLLVTPLRLEGSGAVVLVQRGWVQRNFLDRGALPSVDTPAERVRVVGRVAQPPSKLLALGGGDGPAPSAAPRIRQNLNLADFRVETNLTLMPVTVLQTEGSPGDGLLRDWPVATAGIDKHHGYAFQWFGLSALIATLYIWFQIVRPFRSRRAAATTPVAPTPD